MVFGDFSMSMKQQRAMHSPKKGNMMKAHVCVPEINKQERAKGTKISKQKQGYKKRGKK